MKAAIGIAIALALAGTLAGQSFSFSSFASGDPLVANGSASLSGQKYVLTPAAMGQKGSLFHQNQFDLGGGFETSFDFRIYTSAILLPGEGMAFVIHGDGAGSGFLGDGDDQLGYGSSAGSPVGTGVERALVIEIDPHAGSFGGFSDAGPNEISIHTNAFGEVTASEGLRIGSVVVNGVTLADSQVHNLRIRHHLGLLEVFLDGAPAPLLSVPWDFQSGGFHLASGLGSGGLALPNGGMAWVGFTASTNSFLPVSQHEIHAWSFTTIDPPRWPGDASDFDCAVSINGIAAVTPSRVLTVAAGDLVALHHHSPAGSLVGQPFSAFYQLAYGGVNLVSQVVPGQAPPGGFWLDASGVATGLITPVVPYLDGIGFTPSWVPAVVLPGGNVYGFYVPPQIAGQAISLFLQALVIAPGFNALNLGIDDCIELQIG
ncbi:MAG: hypothetical protein H6807_10280 [Planctomycetes bacterium]|nr:hypothetical protein [Planctomycetota bacterium]